MSFFRNQYPRRLASLSFPVMQESSSKSVYAVSVFYSKNGNNIRGYYRSYKDTKFFLPNEIGVYGIADGTSLCFVIDAGTNLPTEFISDSGDLAITTIVNEIGKTIVIFEWTTTSSDGQAVIQSIVYHDGALFNGFQNSTERECFVLRPLNGLSGVSIVEDKQFLSVVIDGKACPVESLDKNTQIRWFVPASSD